MMEEKEYRVIVDRLFQNLAKSFDEVDPDLAEFELSQGSVVIEFADSSKCIISVQPSVRQIWLAAASKGVAHHFNYSAEKSQWVDDKGKGVELVAFVKDLVHAQSGVELKGL